MAPTALRSAAVTGSLLAVKRDDDAAEPAAEVVGVLGEAEGGHHLGGRRDVEAGLARHALEDAAEADDDVAQRAVVHVEDPPPEHPPRVDAERVAVVDVVVEQRGEQVVGGGDGVEVAGEVEVDVAARDDDRLPPPVAPPFRPKVGPSDGSRSARQTRCPIFASPWARPMEVVVLPSPASVGVIAETRTSLPAAGPGAAQRARSWPCRRRRG